MPDTPSSGLSDGQHVMGSWDCAVVVRVDSPERVTVQWCERGMWRISGRNVSSLRVLDRPACFPNRIPPLCQENDRG